MRILSSSVKNSYEKQALSVARLLKITTKSGLVLALTSLDRDLEFGGIKYLKFGADTSVIADSNKFAISNAEATTLFHKAGITEKSIRAGILDNALWELSEIDYEKMDETLLLDKGVIGVVETKDAQSLTFELLSFANKLTTPYGCLDAKRCRAIFGTEANSMFGCGANSSWISGTVSGVDENESDILFADKTINFSDKMKLSARVQFLSGDNKSDLLYQVESVGSSTGSIFLMEPTPYPIAIGDRFQIRADCNKTPQMCKEYNNFINYKGEPHIPSVDAYAASVPGGQISGGITGGLDE